MIDWLVFIPACLVLNLAFGPNNLLSMTHGAKFRIVFALLIGTFILKERVTRVKIISAGVIVAGAAVLRISIS